MIPEPFFGNLHDFDIAGEEKIFFEVTTFFTFLYHESAPTCQIDSYRVTQKKVTRCDSL